MGVGALEGIKGPGDQIDALLQNELSLSQLQLITDPLITGLGEDAGLQRDMFHPSVLKADEAEREADKPHIVVSPEQAAAPRNRGKQEMIRHYSQLGEAPNSLLESLALPQISLILNGVDFDFHHLVKRRPSPWPILLSHTSLPSVQL